MEIDLFGTKNIEEVKPGVFVKRDPKGRYRAVDPVIWNGKFRFMAFVRRWFMFVMIMFLVWAYVHDTQALREFRDEFLQNPLKFCKDKFQVNVFGDPGCTEIMEEYGLCSTEPTFELQGGEI